jgi:DNA-binding Lrp family transcriptional regulator
MDALEERVLRELADGGRMTAADLARRIGARQWVDLSTVLANLSRSGYVTVIGPLGRPETQYRVHARGLAALAGPD